MKNSGLATRSGGSIEDICDKGIASRQAIC
jgi:hypothetical protein